jgi:ribokinase
MSNLAAPIIAVVGSSNIDLVVRVPRLPLAGETVLGDAVRHVAGGKGANQAVAASRLGADVFFVGCLGDDSFGVEARAMLALEGLRLDHLGVILGEASGVALIAVAANGENSIVVAPGANALLAPADMDMAQPALTQAQLVVAQLEIPLLTVQHAFTLAHAAGVRTLLNPAPAQPLPPEFLALVDVLVCNETEAAALTAMAVTDVAQAHAAAEILHHQGPALVIITLGAQGCVVADATTTQQVQGYAVPVIDTTGAGDTFIGALAVALARGEAAPLAARYANAAAALSVGKVGAQSGMPLAADVATFLATHPAIRA